MELDIWLRSTSYTGKGLGVEAINLLIEYLRKTYEIKTFIIRPWIKNTRAIKAYKKCGFEIIDNFNPKDYYEDGEEEWFDGDYGVEETVNMVKTIK